MKKIMILFFLIFPNFIFAQNGTTVDEYRYLTKGYAYQKEMGLDGTKEGYEVRELFTTSNSVVFSGLYKMDGRLRGVLMTMGKYTENPIYLCLPTNDASGNVKALFEKDVQQQLTLATKTEFDKALLEFALNRAGSEATPTEYIGETEKNTKKEEPKVHEYDVVVPLKVEDNNREQSGQVKFANKSATEKTTPTLLVNQQVETTVNLENRTLKNAPEVHGQNARKGVVVIKVCVDREGKIKTAKFTQRGSTTLDDQLKKLALDATRRASFESSNEFEQCGTITFKFN